MHGNNEHCLAAVRVFPDSIHQEGEPGNCRAACALPTIPQNLLTPPLKPMGMVFDKLQSPAPSPQHGPVEVTSLRVLNFLAHPLHSNF